jgi:hypothetical protein
VKDPPENGNPYVLAFGETPLSFLVPKPRTFRTSVTSPFPTEAKKPDPFIKRQGVQAKNLKVVQETVKANEYSGVIAGQDPVSFEAQLE